MSFPPRTRDFFVAGGALRPNDASYVERSADGELFELTQASQFSYVLTPRQMGKTSLAGNVWEWVEDSYDSNYYASSPRENPVGSLTDRTKVLRGGSWDDTAPYIRVRNRNGSVADYRDVSIGFRCARSP